MKKNGKEERGSGAPQSGHGGYTGAQRVTATVTAMRAMAELKEQMFDDLNDRQVDFLVVLGARDALAALGAKLEPMTAERALNLIMSKLEVSATTADNDLRSLKEKGLIETHADEADRRRRIVALTEAGEAVYRSFADGMADVVVATHRMLVRDGALPARPWRRVRDFVGDVVAGWRDVAVGAAAAAAILLAAPAASDDRKGFFDEGLTIRIEQPIGHLVSTTLEAETPPV